MSSKYTNVCMCLSSQFAAAVSNHQTIFDYHFCVLASISVEEICRSFPNTRAHMRAHI